MAAKKKVNKNTYKISSIKRVTRKFLEVSRSSRAQQRQRNVQKKCAARAKLFFFANSTHVLIFFGCFCCRRYLALHDFMFCSIQLEILTKASLLPRAKSILLSIQRESIQCN